MIVVLPSVSPWTNRSHAWNHTALTANTVSSLRPLSNSPFIYTWHSTGYKKQISHFYLRQRRTLCFYFGLFVCLSLCPSDNWKSCERILTKFLEGVGHGPGTKWLYFGDDPDHRPDPGVWSPKSGFTGLSKKYIVDSDQSCIANLHCKNHSAILLCWRLTEVCAPWVLWVYFCW